MPKVVDARRGRSHRAAERAKVLESLGATAESAMNNLLKDQKTGVVDADAGLTDKQIEERLDKRFYVIGKMTEACVLGISRAMIISGPPGLGKTYKVDEVLNRLDPNKANHARVSGYGKATGLYKLLYDKRSAGQVVVIDDCDAVLFDPVALNILKAACDTTRERTISYLSEYKLVDDESGETIPNQFLFDGTIIFITNIDFDAIIDNEGHSLQRHLGALVSRSHYVDISMKSKRSYMIRINQVVKQGMLKGKNINKSQQDEIMAFVTKHGNAGHLRELSLRIVVKIADLMIAHPKEWEEIAKVTCCRGLA